MKESPPSRELRVRSEGLSLLARYWPSAEASPAGSFLILPGLWGDFRRPAYLRLCESLQTHGAVLAANMRGHPGSGGLFQFGRAEVRDCAPLFAFLESEGRLPVTAIGFSMGGWVLARFLAETPSARNQVRRLVLCGVPSRLPWVLPRPWKKGLWIQLRYGGKGAVRANPLSLWPPQDLVPVVTQLDGIPVSLLHGRNDWMVHHRHTERLLQALPSSSTRVRVVEAAEGLHVEMVALFHLREVLEAIGP